MSCLQDAVFIGAKRLIGKKSKKAGRPRAVFFFHFLVLDGLAKWEWGSSFFFLFLGFPPETFERCTWSTLLQF